MAFAFVKLLFRLQKMKRLADSGIDDIYIMDGKTFEKYLEALLNIVFYRVMGLDVHIDRVLYGRRNYISILFGKLQNDVD